MQNEENPAPYEPRVTAPPEQDAELASMGYYLTTYYECRTRGGNEHCGWHVPVMKAGADKEGAGLGFVVGIVGLVMLL